MPNAMYTQAEFRFANEYLKFKPIEPGVAGLPAIAIDAIPVNANHISMASIYYLAVTKNPGTCGDFLFYVHGSVTGREQGLSLVVDNPKSIVFTHETLSLLEGNDSLSASKRASRLGLSPDSLSVIISAIAEIQVAQLHRLAFRACNIGNAPVYLMRIARLFNAKFVSAPLQRDSFTKADFYRTSNVYMNTLAATGALLPTYEEKAAQIASAKGQAKAKISESGLTISGSGAD